MAWVDTKNRGPDHSDMSISTFPLVKEDDKCPLWECTGDESITPMQECWYCIYSDFRKESSEHQTLSLCHYPLKRNNKGD
jgi:hypothetical protein